MLAQVAAQNGVHKSGLRAETVLFALVGLWVNSRWVGSPVERENWVEAEPQQVLQAGFLFAPICFSSDEPVECRLPAHDAIHDFLAKRAVGGRKLRAMQRGFEQIFNEFAPGASLLQNAHRDFSWFLFVHHV